MEAFQETLRTILPWVEFFSALVGLIYLFRLKNSYWKWFSIYLIFIVFQEYFWFNNNSSLLNITKQEYYAFFGIPIQYLFMYWLYALKSLNNKKLFFSFSILYIFI
ncbi:MAG: hypothetical protein KUG68_10175, partial [Flavobacteriaceae bacterium]|nr:hypothetical protein [Flavobacteriaceae bacterium]